MPKCEYYREFAETVVYRALSGLKRRDVHLEVQIPWCSHPEHSPLNEEQAKNGFGMKGLSCEGIPERCPIGIPTVEVLGGS